LDWNLYRNPGPGLTNFWPILWTGTKVSYLVPGQLRLEALRELFSLGLVGFPGLDFQTFLKEFLWEFPKLGKFRVGTEGIYPELGRPGGPRFPRVNTWAENLPKGRLSQREFIFIWANFLRGIWGPESLVLEAGRGFQVSNTLVLNPGGPPGKNYQTVFLSFKAFPIGLAECCSTGKIWGLGVKGTVPRVPKGTTTFHRLGNSWLWKDPFGGGKPLIGTLGPQETRVFLTLGLGNPLDLTGVLVLRKTRGAHGEKRGKPRGFNPGG